MRRLEHVGIATHDAGRTAAMIEALFERRPYAVETVDREGVRTTFVEAGPVKIELLEATSAESALGRYLEKYGPGLHHLAFEVDDLDLAHARLGAAGFRLLGDPVPGADRKRIFFVHPKDAGHVLVEFCETIPGDAVSLEGQGPDGAPACLVTGSADEWEIIRAMTRRLRVWYSPDGRIPEALPDGHLVVSFGPVTAHEPNVLVDPEAVTEVRPDALVIVRTGGDVDHRGRFTAVLPDRLLKRLPDPAVTLADLIVAHLIA